MVSAVVVFGVLSTICPAGADSLAVVTPCVDRIGFFERFECEMQEVAGAVRSAVVTIYAQRVVRADEFSAPQGGAASGARRLVNVGSGIIFDSLGRVVTVASGVNEKEDFRVELLDGRRYGAVLIGMTDQVAVLELQATGVYPARFAEAVDLTPGSIVAIIGNAYGYRSSVSWGVLSGFRGDGSLLLDCNSAPGSAGGAVANRHGEIVGLLTAKISDSYVLPGQRLRSIGDMPTPLMVPSRRLELPSGNSLAIPITVALDAAQQIVEQGSVDRAYVGIIVSDVESWYAAYYKTDHGVVIVQVLDGSPAAENGLRSGDLITGLGGHTVLSARTFRRLLSAHRPGDVVIVDIVRGGMPLKLSLEMGRSPVVNQYAARGSLQSRPTATPVSTGDAEAIQAAANQPSPREAFAEIGLAPKSTVVGSRNTPPRRSDRWTVDSIEAVIERQERELLQLRVILDSLRESNATIDNPIEP